MSAKANFFAAAVQMTSETGPAALANNIEKAQSLLKEGVQAGARLLVLPEAFNYGYQLNVDTMSEIPENDSTLEFLKKFAQENDVYLSAGILEKENTKIFNRTVTFSPQGEMKKYTKVHLFSSAPTWENKVFTAGQSRQTMESELGQFGFLICYDLRFPEIARALALEGSELFLVSSAWGHARGEHFEALIKARAIENQVFIVSADQVGQNQEGLKFAGRSAIVDPLGNFLAKANSEEETVLIAEIRPQIRIDAKSFMDCFGHRIPQAYIMKDI